jgi:hypothetical protein
MFVIWVSPAVATAVTITKISGTKELPPESGEQVPQTT